MIDATGVGDFELKPCNDICKGCLYADIELEMISIETLDMQEGAKMYRPICKHAEACINTIAIANKSRPTMKE